MLVPTPKHTQMTVVNDSDHPLIFEAVMAETQDKHKEVFEVPAHDRITRSWTYQETDSGMDSAWEQRVTAQLLAPSFYFLHGRIYDASTSKADEDSPSDDEGKREVLWLKGDQTGVTSLPLPTASEQATSVSISVSPRVQWIYSTLWIDAQIDNILEVAIAPDGVTPKAGDFHEATYQSTRTIFQDDSSRVGGIIEGRTYTCDHWQCKSDL
ncbi:hypothetical protein E3A20_12680 [Planctomyces bekefii]|uniref:Uncharacterized protein n=1 Tax=Planctomyces bekefii TaxID=1653850 RepID=A0A5C6M6H7_9PLAN|nr:hypothetical protein E3A20_12680 [Planctomyces bekefii]